MSFTFKPLALLAIALSPCAFSQGGLVGTKTSDGKIAFQPVEELQFDGSHRVRLLPAATRQITPDDAKKYQREDLAQAGMIRTDAAGRIVRWNDGKSSEIVLPDNFAPKTNLDAAAAPGPASILAVQSKKTKASTTIEPKLFFVFVPGAEPDRLALNFINRDSAFLNLDEQLSAMEGFAASFPDSPLRAEFRSQLQKRIGDGIDAFENRGPFTGILLTRRYTDLAMRAFPGDSPLRRLSDAVNGRIQMVQATRLELRSLAASGEWEAFLDAYLPFERYQWSFPDVMNLRTEALEESARLHAHRGALLAERQMHEDALRELGAAIRRDPDNRETAKLYESARVVASLDAAKVAKPHVLPPGTAPDVRFKRSKQNAERAIQDKDFAKAETSIQEAQVENKDSPDLLVVQAKLLAARDRHAQALPLLDKYDQMVADLTAREATNAVRNDILYDMEKKRTAFRQQLTKLQKDGDYAKLRAVSAQALELDSEDEVFLYFGGAAAAVFRDRTVARERLDRYLARSNSLRGDLAERDRALRIRSLLEVPEPAAAPATTGTPNWLSGRLLPDGVYYCPVSGAFQLPIDSIAGYKLKMGFQWDRNRLASIATTFEDEKGSQGYHAMAGAGDSQGNFFFAYTGADPQVQVASTKKLDGPVSAAELRVSHEAPNPPHVVDEHGQPRILLGESPQFNAAVLSELEGPLATGIAGNSFFNPFIWDGLHYFTLTWKDGHLDTAREWNADNLLRFTWVGDRLTEIRAFRKDSTAPYYQRSISYSGNMLLSESYSLGPRTGQIKYVYSGKVLQQVKVEDGGVHDGKTWTVRMR